MDAGFLPRGIGWYRRRFRLDDSDRGRYLAIRFDGVSSHCTVYVNGHLLHRNFCGYTPFTIDISDVARFGDDLNTIAVRVDATPIEGWWYEGAGIFRHVYLTKTHPLHSSAYGVFARPKRCKNGTWDVEVEVNIENASREEMRFDWRAESFDPKGQLLPSAFITYGRVAARSSESFASAAHLFHDVRLWSLQEQTLYRLRT